MKLFAPERPRLPNGRPMYPADRPLAAVPDLVIEFEAEGRRLSAMLLLGDNKFCWHYWHLPITSAGLLQEVLTLWEEDPERTMRECFGWTPPIGGRSSIEELEIEI